MVLSFVGLFSSPRNNKSISKRDAVDKKRTSLKDFGSAPCKNYREFSRTPHDPGYYSSNHVLVNRERTKLDLEPLTRSIFLDKLAQEHAQQMAFQEEVGNSAKTVSELKKRLSAKQVGENVQVGTTIRDMHQRTMLNRRGHARKNILSEKFNEFGMGTASMNGKLYMVQLFRWNEDASLEQ